MKATRSFGQLAAVVLSLSPLVSAWPFWPGFLPEMDALVARQDQSSSVASAASATQTDSSAATGSATGTSRNPQSVKTTNLNTGGMATATGSKGNSSTTGGASHTMYNPQDPAGSVVMLTPAPSLGTQLYKIGDYVTWGWNYTNLQGTPTAVDVLVSCAAVTNTWTLTQNMTFATKGAYTWDTNSYRQTAVGNPLLTELYTLIIYDADSSISATAEAGYLAPFSGHTFGLYYSKEYTPLGEWQCGTCSGAVSDMEKRALGVAAAMSVVTVLSFTWFVTGFGAFI